MARQRGQVRRTPHRGVRRSAQSQIHTTSTHAAPLELSEGRRIGWYPVRSDAKEDRVDGAEVPSLIRHCGQWCRNTVPTLDASRVTFCLEDTRCLQIEVRAHVGGRRLNQGIGRGGEGCDASQLECNDEGSGKFIISG